MSDDSAPSPSIPDPSDERVLTVERLIRRYEDRIHEAVTGDPGQVRWAIYTSVVADLRSLAAARAASLPEAPEPRGSSLGHGIVIDFDFDEPHYWTAVCSGCGWTSEPCEFELEARSHYALHLAPATPSAPPVAVDPEAGAGAS